MSSRNQNDFRAHLETPFSDLNFSNARDLLGLLAAIALAQSLALSVYRIWFHPLSRFPGPPLLSAFYFPYRYSSLIAGSWVRKLPALHQKYGSIVRIAPNQLAIDGTVAWPKIYAHRSGEKKEFGRPKGLFFPGDHASLLGASRDDHRRMRRQLAPAFSDGALNEQEVTITKYVNLLLDKLEEHSQGEGKSLNIVEWLNFATFDIVGDLAFSDSFQSLENDAYHPWVRSIFLGVRGMEFSRFLCSYPILKIGMSIYMSMFSFRSIQAKDDGRMAALEKTTSRMSQGVESKSGHRDFVTCMMQNIRRPAGEPGMSEQEILATTPILVIAGSETTGSAISGLLFYLSQNPLAYDLLAQEVRSAFSSEAGITFRSTANLEYLRACIDETLRVYPPAAETTPRLSPGDFVQGQYIPEGTRISVSPWATFQNPEHFAEPNTFSPQRWLSPSHPLYEERFGRDNREAFKPFSFGTRDCIGKNLAYAEMRLIAARLFYRFDYEIMPGQESWHDTQRIYLGWEKGPLNIQLQRRTK